MKKIWEKYKEVAILLVYAILIACLLEFIILPLNSAIKEKRRHAEEQLIEQEIVEKKVKEIPQLKEKFNNIKQLESKLNVFAESGNALPLIESIEKLAAETGNDIRIEILNEGAKSKESSAKSVKKDDNKGLEENLIGEKYLTMKLNLSGDFNSILGFINKIENFKYFSDIIAIKIIEKEEIVESLPQSVSRPINFMELDSVQKQATDEVKKGLENPLDGILEIVFYLE